jgi:methanogenic corrinoid protein MtbC1
MYTIKHASELTGISEATLRAWERRYGVVRPRRSEGGYRIYDADEIRALETMNSLVLEGWSPREAAGETRRRHPSSVTGRQTGRPASAPGAAALAHRSEDAQAFLRAAQRLDATSAAAVLDARFALGSFERVVDDWLMPTLALVGDAWAEGRLTVAGEHLVSYAVQRRLAAAYEAASSRIDGPRLLIGLPPGARHELGLLAFAVAARRAGFSTAYAGADLPADDWTRVVQQRRADGVVMAIPRSADVPEARSIVEAITTAHPKVVVGLGGSEQNAVTPGLHLGHSITVAAQLLYRRLHASA